MSVALRNTRRNPWSRGLLALGLAAGAGIAVGGAIGAGSAQTISVQVSVDSPVIVGLNPGVVAANQLSTVIITGRGFSGVGFTTVSVSFGGRPATAFSVDSQNQITAQESLAAGVYLVSLTTSTGGATVASGNADQLVVVDSVSQPTAPPTVPPTAVPSRSTLPAGPAISASTPSLSAQPVTVVPPPAAEATPYPTAAPLAPDTPTPTPQSTTRPAQTGDGGAGRASEAPPSGTEGNNQGSGFFGLQGAIGAFGSAYARHLVLSVFATGLLFLLLAGALWLLVGRPRRAVDRRPKIIV